MNEDEAAKGKENGDEGADDEDSDGGMSPNSRSARSIIYIYAY
jgi:hypothetical protein